MPVYYLEPSALVKYYITEPGSIWIRQLVDEENNALLSAEITIAEVSAALAVASVDECTTFLPKRVFGSHHIATVTEARTATIVTVPRAAPNS